MNNNEQKQQPSKPVGGHTKDSGENLPPLNPRPTNTVPPQPVKKK